jgi:hypothetical protein
VDGLADAMPSSVAGSMSLKINKSRFRVRAPKR